MTNNVDVMKMSEVRLNQRTMKWLLVAGATLLAACNAETSISGPEVRAAQYSVTPALNAGTAVAPTANESGNRAEPVRQKALHGKSRYAMAAN